MECEKCKGCEKTTHRSDEEKSKIIKRLNIIEGQVRGIKQMIENQVLIAESVIVGTVPDAYYDINLQK